MEKIKKIIFQKHPACRKKLFFAQEESRVTWRIILFQVFLQNWWLDEIFSRTFYFLLQLWPWSKTQTEILAINASFVGRAGTGLKFGLWGLYGYIASITGFFGIVGILSLSLRVNFEAYLSPTYHIETCRKACKSFSKIIWQWLIHCYLFWG